MSISYVSQGTVNTQGAASFGSFPSTLAAGDLILYFIWSDVPTTPLLSSGGFGAPAIGPVGPAGGLYLHVYAKTATGSETGNITTTISGASSVGASWMVAYRGTVATPIPTFRTGLDTDNTSNIALATGSSWSPSAGDVMVAAAIFRAPSGSYTSSGMSQTLTSSGSTLGTQTQRFGARLNSNTAAFNHSDRQITSGAPGTPSYSGTTQGANAAGVVAFVLLTETSPNTAPIADAGDDQEVLPWQTVTLDGSGSTDAEGIASYSWAQTSGSPTVSLSGTGATRTFEAPSVLGGTTLTFTLTVTDTGGLTDTDTVSVDVASGTKFFFGLSGVLRPGRTEYFEE